MPHSAHRFCLALMLCTCFLGNFSQAAIYTWKDAQGKTHFSDSPPPNAKAREMTVRDNSVPAFKGTYTPSASRESTKRKPSVVIYTATWCGYCKQAKALLNSRGVSYTEYDIENSAEGQRDYAQLKGHGIPLTLIGETRLDGFSAQQFNSVLTEAGY